MPRATVIVPARNAAATIGRTLSALAAQQLEGGFEVIVVDSGSSDATPRIAAAFACVREVLANPGGEPAGSRNLGAAAAAGTLLAFTDADCEPEPGWLAAGLAALERADLVQGAVLPAEGPRTLFDRTVSVAGESGLFETASLFVRRELFERLGGFEPVLEIGERAPFGEDVWLGWRARRGGARTAFCAEARVRHAVFPRTKAAYALDQRRRGHFPALVARIPELRDAALYRRAFLSRQTAAFDLAAAGLLAAAAGRRRAPMLLALPYAALLARATAGLGRHRPAAMAALAAGDTVGAAALVRASIAARTPVL